VQATFLLDGFVAGLWRWEETTRSARLILYPFTPLRRNEEEALRQEAESLLRFVAANAEEKEVLIQ
ncbi:MAG: hypothetical protein C4335_14485, partial [Armatimonadota bacterium]